MKGFISRHCLALLTFAFVQTVSGQQINGRFEILKNGDQVFVPNGMTMIPGVPVVLSDRDMKQVATARQQLDNLGYVDRPNDTSFAFNTLRSCERGWSGSRTDVPATRPCSKSLSSTSRRLAPEEFRRKY